MRRCCTVCSWPTTNKLATADPMRARAFAWRLHLFRYIVAKGSIDLVRAFPDGVVPAPDGQA